MDESTGETSAPVAEGEREYAAPSDVGALGPPDDGAAPLQLEPLPNDLEALTTGAAVQAEMMRYVRHSMDGTFSVDGATNTGNGAGSTDRVSDAGDDNIASYTRDYDDDRAARSGMEETIAEAEDEGEPGPPQEQETPDAGADPTDTAAEESPPPPDLEPVDTDAPPDAAPAPPDPAADQPTEADTLPPPQASSSAGSRPPSGAHNSRPPSRPMSARPTSARPTSGRPASSSRPPSGSQPSLPPPAEEPEPAPAPAPVTQQAPPAPPPPTYDLKQVAPGLKALDVEIVQGQGLPNKVVRVLLDSTQLDRKPYLGGFRSKTTGVVYHHAATQTPRQPKYTESDRKLSRDTQTVKMVPHSQQTKREAATQMARPGVVIDETYDRVRTPGKYQTADEWLAIVERATRTIQRFARGWAGRKRAAYLREKKRERELFLREQELQAQQEAEEHRRREIERRMHPRTAADFEILYNELEAWRLQETRKIKEAGLPQDKEQLVLQQLLHKETKLLQTIDRLKINANHENKDLRIQRTLGAMGKPKLFELKNGGKVEVHTPFTTRAKELQQLYNGLNLPNLSTDERLDVLLHVKWTVKEFDCALTREVVDLIDREADLLNRGRSPAMLEGLRKRISSLFLNFTETPEFNPEAVRFQIVPMDFEAFLYDQAETRSQSVQRKIAAM